MHVEQMTQLIIDNEGEGSIFRKCSSLYASGRSLSLFKVKVRKTKQIYIFTHCCMQTFQGDSEALIVADYGDWYLLQLYAI